jgi:hypothetical protein
MFVFLMILGYLIMGFVCAALRTFFHPFIGDRYTDWGTSTNEYDGFRFVNVLLILAWPIAGPIVGSIYSLGHFNRVGAARLQVHEEEQKVLKQKARLEELEIQKAIKQLEKEGL